MFVMMSKVALPKVGSVIDARRQHNENNLAAAARAQTEGDAIKLQNDISRGKASEQAQSALLKAEQTAAEKANAEMARFGEQARHRVAAAEAAIAKARAEAMASVTDIAAEAACEIAHKVAGVSVQKADARKVVANIVQKESA
jgi:F-type H+-transporting ATPase subunit b